jgi:hypothetical protein
MSNKSKTIVCNKVENFVSDIGGLSLIGPSPLDQDRTCISGHTCTVDGLIGNSLSMDGHIMVMDTCSLGNAIPRFPLAGEQTTLDKTVFSFGSIVATAAGGKYRLCWCMQPSASPAICSTMNNFKVDVGAFTLIGPVLNQKRTCVSGRTCNIDGISGKHLSDGDLLLVLETCAASISLVPRFVESDQRLAVTEDGANMYWGSTAVTAAGGVYQLCWCAGPGGNGSSYVGGTSCDDFVDIGSLDLLGLSPLQQDRTCVAGQKCFLDGLVGHWVPLESYVLILETCGTPSNRDRFTGVGLPATMSSTAMNAIGLFNSSVITSSGNSFSWGSLYVSASGGLYRLCWCAADTVGNATGMGADTELSDGLPCGHAEHFRVDAGAFTIRGPVLHASMTCVSGQPCVIDNMLGQHLMDGDRLLALDSCGTYAGSLVPKFSQSGLTVNAATSGASVDWGSFAITAAGGIYQLCWCAVGFSCSIAEDYRVSMGTLSIRGPSPIVQDRTCISGLPCSFEGMHGLDILGNSAQDVSAIRIVASGVSHFEVSHGLTSSINGSWTMLTCFCDANVSSCDATVSGVSECFLNMSLTSPFWKLSFLPAPHADYPIIHEVQLYSREGWVSLNRLTVVDVSAPPLSGSFAEYHLVDGNNATKWASGPGGPWEIVLSAHETDHIMVLATCGMASPGSPNLESLGSIVAEQPQVIYGPAAALPTITWGSHPITAQGGLYRMCWCAHTSGCSTTEDFQVDLGRLTIIGPSPTNHRTCVSGQICALDGLTGQHLSDSDRIFILGTCGIKSMIPRMTSVGTRFTVFSSGSNILSTIEPTAAGGTYRLCWCAGVASQCTLASEFRVDAGALTLVGVAPLRQHRTCVSGQTCSLRGFTGFVSKQDRFLALDTCGIATSLARQSTFMAPQAENRVTCNATAPIDEFNNSLCVPTGNTTWTTLEWQSMSSAAGGQYRLCWCTGIMCSSSEAYRVDAGQFTLIGVSPLLQRRTCISGWTCQFDGIVGHGLSSGDVFEILDTCGYESVISRNLGIGTVRKDSSEGVTVTWGSNVVTSPGGQYRMCWCAVENFPCATAEAFRVDAGALYLQGPSPLLQDRTCVSGNRCKIAGITGFGLSSTDVFMVLDTCGNSSLIHRFSFSGLLTPFTHSGASAISAPLRLSMMGNESIVSVQTIVTAQGGQYRLCWFGTGAQANLSYTTDQTNEYVSQPLAADGSMPFVGCCNLTNASQRNIFLAKGFQVDVGEFRLIGPAPLNQGRTCVSGQTCWFGGIIGQDLSSLDAFAVLDTCRVPAAQVDMTSKARSDKASVEFTVPTHVSGGQYRLCWCAQFNTCEFLDEYAVDAGGLMMVGPLIPQDRTCISGRTCEIESLLGQGLSSTDSYWVLDTCGSAGFAAGYAGTASLLLYFPRDGASVEVTTKGSTVSWGQYNYVTTHGGLYRLCWCAGSGVPSNTNTNTTSQATNASSGFHCSVAEHHRVDVGEFTLIGPNLHGTTRTCVAGQTCVIDGITGPGLSNNDRYLVMETCGVVDVLPRTPFDGGSTTTLHDGTTVSWGSVAATAAGGEYRLCWCSRSGWEGTILNASDQSNVTAHEHMPCRYPEDIHDFRVDVTSLTLAGMSYLGQDRTCISGETCLIDGLLGAAEGFVIALDTCGDGLDKNVKQTGALISWGDGMLPRVSWGAKTQTYSGGIYRLCWCSHHFDCQVLTDYRQDFGALHAIGPNPKMQDRTCVSGQTCLLAGFYGHYLSATDGVMVLDTCGTGGLPLRWPGEKSNVSVPYVGDLNLTTNTPSIMVTWGDVPISSGGGEYRLCWSGLQRHMGPPGVMDDNITGWIQKPYNYTFEPRRLGLEHRLNMGSMKVIGPSLTNDNTCISGHTCTIRLNGYYMTVNESMVVMDTCGVSSIIEGFSAKGYLHDSTPWSVSTTWDAASITTAGGQYRLCWCSASIMPCETADMFRTDAGRLVVKGPAPLQQAKTCIASHYCAIEGFIGESLSSTDRFLLLDTCGTASQPETGAQSIQSKGTSAVFDAPPGGVYRLCWCGVEPIYLTNSSGAAAIDYCTSPSDYRVDLGQMVIIGPLRGQKRTCVSGQVCSLDGILGEQLWDGDTVAVLDTCGAPGAVHRVREGGIIDSASSSGSRVSWGIVPVTASGGQYRLCWCRVLDPNNNLTWFNPDLVHTASPNVTGVGFCNRPDTFKSDFGSLMVRGPAPLTEERSCIGGDPCILSFVYGVHLDDRDQFRMLDTCGTGISIPRTPNQGLLATIFLSGAPANFTLHKIPNTAAGGQYRLCWCAHEWPCSLVDSFRVDVGEMKLQGPSPLQQDRTCINGQTCLIEGITGLELNDYDKVLVMDTCARRAMQGGFSLVSITGSGARFLAQPAPLVFGGEYRLCWCSGALNKDLNYTSMEISEASGNSSAAAQQYRCSLSEHFKVDFGTITLRGPYPLSQAFTCISGQTCSIDGITGMHLQDGDRMSMLDTCGVSSIIARSTHAGFALSCLRLEQVFSGALLV